MKICIEEYNPRELKILFIQNGIFSFVIRWISGEFCNAFWLQIVRNAWEFVKKGLKLLSEPKIGSKNAKPLILNRFAFPMPKSYSMIAHLLFCYPQLIIRLGKKRTGIHNLL